MLNSLKAWNSLNIEYKSPKIPEQQSSMSENIVFHSKKAEYFVHMHHNYKSIYNNQFQISAIAVSLSQTYI